MSAKFTYIIPDDAGPHGPYTWAGGEPFNVSFAIRVDCLPRPEFITVKDVTNGIDYKLPVLPCGCVGECACACETMLLSEPVLAREWDAPAVLTDGPHFCSMCLSGHVHEGRGDGPCTHREEYTVCVCNWSSADIEALRERVEREWLATKWQVMERSADEDIAAGRYTEYTNMQALIDDLTPDDEPDPHAAPTGDLALGQDREDDV